MNSREKILAAVKKNQPPLEELPSLREIDAIAGMNHVQIALFKPVVR